MSYSHFPKWFPWFNDCQICEISAKPDDATSVRGTVGRLKKSRLALGTLAKDQGCRHGGVGWGICGSGETTVEAEKEEGHKMCSVGGKV